MSAHVPEDRPLHTTGRVKTQISSANWLDVVCPSLWLGNKARTRVGLPPGRLIMGAVSCCCCGAEFRPPWRCSSGGFDATVSKKTQRWAQEPR